MNEDKLKRLLKKISWPLIAISMVLGTASLLYEGHSLSDSLYGAIAYFGFQMAYGDWNIGVAIVRWLAPMSVATTVVLEIAPIFRWFSNRVIFSLNRTVVYSDNESGRALCNNCVKKPVLVEDKDNYWKAAKKSVILRTNDEENLVKYRELRERGEQGIILCLNDLEPNLIPSTGDTIILNINDLTAGAFWQKTFNILKRNDVMSKKDINIALVGYSSLGKRMLYKGLLLNIFSTTQNITYSILETNADELSFGEEISDCTGNADKIVFYHDFDEFKKQVLGNADAIIITEELEPEEILSFLYHTKKCDIYYYDPKGIGVERVFEDVKSDSIFKRLHSYGVQREIITEDKIFNNRLYNKAKKLNASYLRDQGKLDLHANDYNSVVNEEWNNLDGFTKGSNVNAIDFAFRGKLLKDRGVLEEELAELEHIRWSRYHLLNHIRFAPGPKNIAQLQHPCLVPYDKLSEEEKEKDRQVVRMW